MPTKTKWQAMTCLQTDIISPPSFRECYIGPHPPHRQRHPLLPFLRPPRQTPSSTFNQRQLMTHTYRHPLPTWRRHRALTARPTRFGIGRGGGDMAAACCSPFARYRYAPSFWRSLRADHLTAVLPLPNMRSHETGATAVTNTVPRTSDGRTMARRPRPSPHRRA